MIELLVSFVIFSFGMLGVAGLQTKTLSFSQSSLYRSQASALTDDIMDRMRADRLGALAGKWNTPIGDLASSVSVTGTSIASTDLADWKRQVEALLPEGRAAVSVATDVGNVGVATVIIQWDDSRKREDAVKFETVSRI
jgi:type IV pilus assembly protein PilV